MRIPLKTWLIVAAACLAATMHAVDLKHPPEDFVRASVMIASPGESLYSCTGHAFLRMQCPSQNMDFCFSYESEDVNDRILSFLGNRLRMGLVAVRTQEYLASYAAENRGVTEYPLELPIKVKQNLWRVLDGHVDEGMELPYDYMQRGCAISVLHLIEEAVAPDFISVGVLPDNFLKSRRELLTDELRDAPWQRMFINILTNGSANAEVSASEKAITPSTLVTILRHSTLDGNPILNSGISVSAPDSKLATTSFPSPSVFAFLLSGIAVIFAFRGSRWILYLFLTLTSVFGFFNFYLVFISDLCATEWSWLIIPFNPLPLIAWRYRAKWLIPFGIVVMSWALLIMVLPGALTDPAIAILAASSGIVYLSEGCRINNLHLFAKFHIPRRALLTNLTN